ncbi:MAG: hypothetical protein AAF826_00090 [Pseudomonadota bacterium]
MKHVLSDIWDLIKDLFVILAKGLDRIVVIILAATLVGGLIGAGIGLFSAGEVLTSMIIGAVIGFILAVAILFLHALYGPY